MQFGNKIIWWLYLAGAVAGGLAMNFGMAQLPMVVPQVGADAALAAMVTFYGLFNSRHVVYLFFAPVPMWVHLSSFRLFWESWPCIPLSTPLGKI